MTKLFDNIDDNELPELLRCLNAVKKTFLETEIIFESGQTLTSLAYIAEGSINIFKDDFCGNKILIKNLLKNETFGEAIVCSNNPISPNFAVANTKTTVFFIDIKKILSVCSNNCCFHKQLIENLLKIISDRNIFLNERIELITQKSLREKIIFFLKKQKEAFKSEIFPIPFSREEMSQYLCVNRSALSRELSLMKKEKLIDFHKNSFKLFV